MPSFANPAAPRPGEVAGTLRLLAYLAISVVLIVLDHRGGWLSQARDTANLAVQPLWQLAGLPARLGQTMRQDAVTRAMLAEDNRRLRNELLMMGARQAQLQVEADENARLRGLVGAAARGGLDVQLAPILDVDLDPSRQRLLLNAGARDGVRQGQSVIDAGGLLGQIIAVTPDTATVLLLTDLDHAVPVSISRTGVRLLAYGIGRSDRLELRNIPVSGDVQVGDVVVTSGLGGRFPAGFPVGRIVDLRPDDSQAFLIGELAPTAQLDRGRDVLLLRENRDPAPGAVHPEGGPVGAAGQPPGPEVPVESTGGDQAPATGAPDSGPAEAAGRQPEPRESTVAIAQGIPPAADAPRGAATEPVTVPAPTGPGQAENSDEPGAPDGRSGPARNSRVPTP